MMSTIISNLNSMIKLTEKLKKDINHFDKNKDRISRNNIIINTWDINIFL